MIIIAYFSILILCVVCLQIKHVMTISTEIVKSVDIISAKNDIDKMYSMPCIDQSIITDSAIQPNCRSEICGRRIVDNIFTTNDITKLYDIVNKAMLQRAIQSGPTILDINTGYIRDTKGLDNLFLKDNNIYTNDDFQHYGDIIKKLKEQVMLTFNINNLYFTAPTFITRINAEDPNWDPKGIHDEYWHPHVDHNNTNHYHYSGLLYMSTYGDDFEGGKLNFVHSHKLYEDVTSTGSWTTKVSQEDIELQIEPRAGRLALFTSGLENTHFVERVTSGQRFVLSFWFTCDKKREFEIFLDGKAHTSFSKKLAMELSSKKSKQKPTKEL